jgi:hypothetical protein
MSCRFCSIRPRKNRGVLSDGGYQSRSRRIRKRRLTLNSRFVGKQEVKIVALQELRGRSWIHPAEQRITFCNRYRTGLSYLTGSIDFGSNLVAGSAAVLLAKRRETIEIDNQRL